jgi:molybdopterin/thiamine biosynthesis adenylyltransferase
VTHVPAARPRIKEVFGVFLFPGRVRLGTGEGYAAEIDDPDGRYGRLVTLLDGNRSVQQVVEELRDTFSADEVSEALNDLADAGYLEDAAVGRPDDLSADEAERYRANVHFFNTLKGVDKYELQLALKRMRVGLIGMGGIGSNVALALAELGVGTLVAIDFDKIELSNLNRQVLYSTPEVGDLKAIAAARRLKVFNPNMTVTAAAERITSQEEATRFVRDAAPDVVFCLADKPNGHIDHWVNRACVEQGVPMVAGSIFAANGNAYSVIPGRTACYHCRVTTELENAPALTEEFDHIRDADFSAVTAATGPSCMFHAYFLVYEMLRITQGIAPPLTSDRLFEINFVTFEQQYTDFPRREDCAVCGPVGHVRGPVGHAGDS